MRLHDDSPAAAVAGRPAGVSTSPMGAPGDGHLDDRSVEALSSVPAVPWLDDAACGSLALDRLEMFFVEAGRTIAAETVALCRRCPVRRECLDHAYQYELTSGYFGGISPSRRRSLTRDAAFAELERQPTTSG